MISWSQYTDWFNGPTSLPYSGGQGGEPNNVGSVEDKVELRMCCDG